MPKNHTDRGSPISHSFGSSDEFTKQKLRKSLVSPSFRPLLKDSEYDMPTVSIPRVSPSFDNISENGSSNAHDMWKSRILPYHLPSIIHTYTFY